MICRRGNEIIQTFCKIGSPQKLRAPCLICRNWKTLIKVLLNYAECLKSNEWRRVLVHKTFKIKIQTGEQIIQPFCRIGPPPQIKSTIFNMCKFQNSEKTTRKSCRMHWNLVNDEEIWSITPLKLKYRRGAQIIQPFCKIGSPQKLGPLCLICRNFKTLINVLVNYAEWVKI